MKGKKNGRGPYGKGLNKGLKNEAGINADSRGSEFCHVGQGRLGDAADTGHGAAYDL